MGERQEIRLSGSGGQGIILAGIILAEAAIIDGKQVVQTQSYGPEARGGASKAEVIISTESIDYPEVSKPDVVLAMTQEACDKYCVGLDPAAFVIVDTTFVHKLPLIENNIHGIPITRLVKQHLGRELFANIMALGCTVQLTQVVSKEALIEAVLSRVPKGTEELNRKALELGFTTIPTKLANLAPGNTGDSSK